MKNQKLFCAAAVLSLALSVPVYAGDMQTPAFVPPPPPAQGVGEAETPKVDGDVTTTAAGQDSTDLFIELLLSAFTLY